jgi:adenine-specific DNA methylase
MIERTFDVPFVAQLAQREKQIQQSYRPIIGVHKWFARRPGALFRALLLAEFADNQPLAASYFSGHDLGPLVVGDPFMGGGSPLFEASRLGCHVVGVDINPMAYWIVRQELAELDLVAFQAAAEGVITRVEGQIGHLYETTCTHCERPNVPVKYFLWVKQQPCGWCDQTIDLFSNYVLAKNQRHPKHVLVCAHCRALNEVTSLKPDPGSCHSCGERLRVREPGGRNRVLCPHCGRENRYPIPRESPPRHHLFAIEYHCPHCAPTHAGRFFKQPDPRDWQRFQEAEEALMNSPQHFIPVEEIPAGDETARLHRWGYRAYRQLFNPRQLLGLQTLTGEIAALEDGPLQRALLTVFSDTLRYQNMLCRYDSYALKIIDIFSVHGFPVSVTQCENSLLGIPRKGSGGFRHFVEKYHRAKAYGERPFEKSFENKRKIYPSGEKISARLVSDFPHRTDLKSAYLQAAPASEVDLPPDSLDAVLTDPPYFANVQYAELMDFCYVWLKKHLAPAELAFNPPSTRTEQELTVNETEGRDVEHFTDGLSQIFVNFARALKAGAPFAFTYHHNDAQAYFPIAVALLDSALVCTATLPCPAEMGASIHINGTKSSVIDTVFVCRSTGKIRARDFEFSTGALERLLEQDIMDLAMAGHTASAGDVRCLLLGHMVRLAVWQLRSTWQSGDEIAEKLKQVRSTLNQIYPLDLISRLVSKVLSAPAEVPLLIGLMAREEKETYDARGISF